MPNIESKAFKALNTSCTYSSQDMQHLPIKKLLNVQVRVMFDWPGAGRSDFRGYDPTRHATLEGYATDLLKLLEELQFEDIVYVGHSVAASIGAIACNMDPTRFGLLVMLTPTPCFQNDLVGYQGGFSAEQLQALVQSLSDNHTSWSASLAPVIMGNPNRPALASHLEAKFCAMDPTIAKRWAAATFFSDARAEMQRLQRPVVLLHSKEDALVPGTVWSWFDTNLPTARTRILDATGHCPHVSHPGEVTAVLDELCPWRG
jgi:sigma-B regulation protein RsbQ